MAAPHCNCKPQAPRQTLTSRQLCQSLLEFVAATVCRAFCICTSTAPVPAHLLDICPNATLMTLQVPHQGPQLSGMVIFTGKDTSNEHNGRAQPEVLQPPDLPVETAANAPEPQAKSQAPARPEAQGGQGSQRLPSLGLPASSASAAASEGEVHAPLSASGCLMSHLPFDWGL